MANVPRVKYFTEERKALINPDNLKKYQKYLQSSIIKNKDVKDTTYKIYDNYFVQFLVYIAENWDNIDIYSEDFMYNVVDIMEGFISAFLSSVKYFTLGTFAIISHFLPK